MDAANPSLDAAHHLGKGGPPPVLNPLIDLVLAGGIDLHLGGRLEHDVLRRSEPLAALLSALDDIDRLVLGSDVGGAELLPKAEAPPAMPAVRVMKQGRSWLDVQLLKGREAFWMFCVGNAVWAHRRERPPGWA